MTAGCTAAGAGLPPTHPPTLTHARTLARSPARLLACPTARYRKKDSRRGGVGRSEINKWARIFFASFDYNSTEPIQPIPQSRLENLASCGNHYRYI
jgi:hypothetical protein